MNLSSQVEQNVAHWILFVGFSVSLAVSFYVFFQVSDLNFVSASYSEEWALPAGKGAARS